MKTLREHSEEVQKYLAGKGKIKLAKASKGGNTYAKVKKEWEEYIGSVFLCENNPKLRSFNGRDHLRQRSQKIGWTKKVRTNMGKTLQHREHKMLIREGKVSVGAGLMPELLKTGTND